MPTETKCDGRLCPVCRAYGFRCAQAVPRLYRACASAGCDNEAAEDGVFCQRCADELDALEAQEDGRRRGVGEALLSQPTADRVGWWILALAWLGIPLWYWLSPYLRVTR